MLTKMVGYTIIIEEFLSFYLGLEGGGKIETFYQREIRFKGYV